MSGENQNVLLSMVTTKPVATPDATQRIYENWLFASIQYLDFWRIIQISMIYSMS